MKNAGFDAYRGTTGLHDRGKYDLPFGVQDAEIVFAEVTSDSFAGKDRTASATSVEEDPFFLALIRETWQKAGWTVFFIAQDTPPRELEAVGLFKLGVIVENRQYIGEWLRSPLTRLLQQEMPHGHAPYVPAPQIPRFRGQAVRTIDDPISQILMRHIKLSAQMSVLTSLKVPDFIFRSTTDFLELRPHIAVFGYAVETKWLIQDASDDLNALAIELVQSVNVGSYGKPPQYNKGGILLIPNFQENNVNVALALLQEVFSLTSPHLFDTPQHPWLEKYQSIPVDRLLSERDSVIEKARQRIEELQSEIEVKRQEYAWLSGLLVSSGDQFATDTASALRFLGFEVSEIDNVLAPNARRREDFHIRDRPANYFVLGEAKSTGAGRGAAEDFINKTQNHQAVYSHEYHQEPPSALLIINYAIDLDPIHRTARFYSTEEVIGRLEDSHISALNSVALFDLCQFVLAGQISKEQARQFLRKGQSIIVSVTPEELMKSIGSSAD